MVEKNASLQALLSPFWHFVSINVQMLTRSMMGNKWLVAPLSSTVI